jgi:hypothetical protein
MNARRIIIIGISLASLSLGFGIVGNRKACPDGSNGTAAVQLAQGTRPRLDLRRLPLSFEENTGQACGAAKFIARGPHYSLLLEPSGAVMSLHRLDADSSADLRIKFEGASQSARMSAEEKLVGVSHYFIGSDPAAWKTNIAHFAKVRTFNIYPGIDLVFYGNQTELEFDLVVAPGADPSRISLDLEGARGVKIDERGDLLADMGGGTLRLRRPNVYQGSGDDPESVEGNFVLLASNRIAFEVAPYDRNRPLVIDPAIVYATYFGGSWMGKVAVDSAGSLCYVGAVEYAGFPTSNALYPSFRGGSDDAFVSKLNPSGDTLLFSTYFGGSGRDLGRGIAVDTDGDIYITGETESPDLPMVFPIQATFGGSGSVGFGDGFVTKMKSDGSALIYSTYLGGSDDELAWGIAVDAGKNAYVTGTTASGDFPTANPYQPSHRGGGSDCFVSKVNAAGSALAFSTYLGGSGLDSSLGFGKCDIAVTSKGSAVVVGHTNSADFPVVNAFQSTYGGGGYTGDAFVTKFDPSGQSLVFSTYLGGSGNDKGVAVATDAAGTVYVAGLTFSTNFPIVNPYQASHAGGEADAFIAAFNPDGTALYATYLGGSGYENTGDITVNALGNAYVVGSTTSTNFATVDPIQASLSGDEDAFISVFAADGASLAFSTFLGGTGGDNANSIRLDADGNIYIGGVASPGFPVKPSPSTFAGGLLLAKIEAVPFVPGPPITSLVPSSASAGDPGFLLSVVGEDFVDGAIVRWDGIDRPTTFVSSSEVDATIAALDLAAGKTVMVTVRNPDTGVSNALAFTINNPVPTMASISPTGVSGGGSAFTLTVQGSNFVPNSIVHWNSSNKTTTFISGAELQAAITSNDLLTPGTVQVTVLNPAPAGGTSTAAVFSVSGYTAASSPASATVTAGQAASYTITMTPQYGSFDSAISFSCVGLPNKCTATFSPTTVTPGAAAASTTLTLATQASSGSGSVLSLGVADFGPPALGLIAVLSLLLWAGLRERVPWKLTRRWLTVGVLVCLIILIGSCSSGGGGGNNPTYTGTPKGTHQITVQAVSGTISATTAITLVVN